MFPQAPFWSVFLLCSAFHLVCLCSDQLCQSDQNHNDQNPDNQVKHFKKNEFTCKCGCKLNNTDLDLVKVLDSIRDHFNRPIIISSGCRCTKHNREVGGVRNSKHLYGKAADIVVSNVSTADVLNYVNTLVKSGRIRYAYGQTRNMGNAVHIDIN